MKEESVISGLFAASCLLALLAGCGEQGEFATEAGAGGPSPRITFEKVAYDFGEIGVNTKRTDEIPFTNTGDAVLKITKVEGCCGVNVKLDKTELAPGETGTVTMEWTAKAVPSVMMWRLVVHSNDRTKPEVPLTMKAKLVQRIAWEPRRLRLCLGEENAGCPKLTLRSLDGRPFSITGFKSTADCITIDYDPSTEATAFVVEPKVNVEKLQKNLQGRLSLALTHPEGGAITILFDVLPKYTMDPKLLTVFGAAPGKPTVRKLKVLSNYGQVPEVESISSMGETIAVKMLGQKEIPKGCELEVEITPLAPAVEGKIVFAETFSLNLKGGEQLSITCNAYYATQLSRPKAKAESGAT